MAGSIPGLETFCMILSTLPLLLALSQKPAQQEPAPATPARLDVVELKNGDSLTGVVVAELDGYVELRLEAGAVVGLSRALIQSVRRAAVERPVVAASVRPDDSWFVLHDAVGASVGWLHACTKVDDQGRITASEEYEFVEGVRRYQVTNLCVADADGAPRSAYFRERISMPSLVAQRLPVPDAAAAADRVLDERIVEATVDGERLRVVRLDGHGRHERQLPWVAEATFPLLARTLARHGATVVGPTTMYDAASEQLVERAVDGTGVRQVVLDGRRQRVVEIAETHAGHRNAEWVDAEMRTIRRELAGPSLVAVPTAPRASRAPSCRRPAARSRCGCRIRRGSPCRRPRSAASASSTQRMARTCSSCASTTSRRARRARPQPMPLRAGSRCCIPHCASRPRTPATCAVDRRTASSRAAARPAS
jgi:hypothetical protein